MATRPRIRSCFTLMLLPSFATLYVGCSSKSNTHTSRLDGATSGGAFGSGGSLAVGTGGASTFGGGGSAGADAPLGGAVQGGGGGSVSSGGIVQGGGGSGVSSGGTAQGGRAAGGVSGGGGVNSRGGVSGRGGASGRGGGDGSGGGGGTDGPGGATDAGVYNPDFVEFYGEECDVGEPHEANTSKLPDLFALLDGSRMSKKSQWRCHRAELKKAVEKYIHGQKPGKPATVTGSVSKSSVNVHVEHNGKTADFSASVSVPAGASGPVPAIIVLGDKLTLDSSIVAGEWVATITFDYVAMADPKTRSGLFSGIYGNTGASAQIGWAWAVSRIIDVLVAERDAGRNSIIDPTAVGVTGCYVPGKGAFTIGAFDERIALGIPQESGTGGVSAFRMLGLPGPPDGKQAISLDAAWADMPGLFGAAFSDYKNKVNSLPVDAHSIAAMYAPRGLLVLDNSRIGELGSTAQHGAAAAAAESYQALGVEKNIAYHGGRPSDPQEHCGFPAEQADALRRAIRAHLTRKAAPDGRMEPQPIATAKLADWIDWDTPTLTND